MNRFVLAALLGMSLSGAAFARHHPCRADRMKLCKDVKPGEGRIKACLNDHQADLSPKCKKGIDKYNEMEGEKK
ncbi:MAG: hypothetical protein LC689_09625 [Myxococcales bacterium]|nr:hypothetical protein [Myxococcales bacterium]